VVTDLVYQALWAVDATFTITATADASFIVQANGDAVLLVDATGDADLEATVADAELSAEVDEDAKMLVRG